MMRNFLFYTVLGFIAVLFAHEYAGAEAITENLFEGPVLSLRDALARGIQKNLDLQVERINISIRRQEVTVSDAEFDPVVDASVFSQEQRTPTATALAQDPISVFREAGGDVGIGKKFSIGLESRLAIETSRSENNSSIDALRPQYRDFFVLDLTQPLLRDFGSKVNTANLRISKNEVRQATYRLMDQAQRIGEEIEIAYYDLAEALEVLKFRIRSRELARELFEGNRKKFERGIVPITEVQQAETALASRDEQVVFARQRAETVSNRLKDLLEMRPGDILYDEVFGTEQIPGLEQAVPNRESALLAAFKNRPDLQQLHLEVSKLDIRVEFYGNQKLPRVDLEGTFGVNGLSGGDRPVTFAGTPASSPFVGNYADALSGMLDEDGYEWFVGLRFSYPLGNRASAARYRRAEQEKRQAIFRLKRLEGLAETEVKNALVAVQRSLERVHVGERFEALAQKTLQQEMERLKGGLSDTFRVLDFQDDFIEAQIRKMQALVDFNQGLANLYRAIGTNLDRYNIVAEINTKETGYE